MRHVWHGKDFNLTFNQMLHYCHEFNNFIVRHHKLSFHITMTLLFASRPPNDALQMCYTTFKEIRSKHLV